MKIREEYLYTLEILHIMEELGIKLLLLITIFLLILMRNYQS